MAAGHVHCEGGFVVHGVIGHGHGKNEFHGPSDGHLVVLLDKNKFFTVLAQLGRWCFVKQAM
jgi:hypothetical protein